MKIKLIENSIQTDTENTNDNNSIQTTSENDDKCIICLESTNDNENPLVLPCKCKLYRHKKCLIEWMNINGDVCEICKDPIKYTKKDVPFYFNPKFYCNFLYIIFTCVSVFFTFDIYFFNFVCVYTFFALKCVLIYYQILYICVCKHFTDFMKVYWTILINLSGLLSYFYIYAMFGEYTTFAYTTILTYHIYSLWMYNLRCENGYCNYIKFVFDFICGNCCAYFSLGLSYKWMIAPFIFYGLHLLILYIEYVFLVFNNIQTFSDVMFTIRRFLNFITINVAFLLRYKNTNGEEYASIFLVYMSISFLVLIICAHIFIFMFSRIKSLMKNINSIEESRIEFISV